METGELIAEAVSALRACGMNAEANTLESLAPVTDRATARAAMVACHEAGSAAFRTDARGSLTPLTREGAKSTSGVYCAAENACRAAAQVAANARSGFQVA